MEDTLYTHGLYLCQKRFERFEAAKGVFDKVISDQPWNSISKDIDKYKTSWKGVTFRLNGKNDEKLIEQFPAIREIFDYFQCPVNTVAFYRAEPGLRLHSHIDMSGHLGFGRLRFHIPVKTNPKAVTIMGAGAGKPFHLAEGEMWALDTSHLHAVENNGNSERVHLMVEVEVNDWIWSMLPKRNMKYYAHMTNFFVVHVPRAIVRRRLAKLGLVKNIGYE